MKILMVDKFYFIKGGAERYFFELSHILESKGHTLIPFSMKHPRNFDTPVSRYFVDHIDFNAAGIMKNPVRGIRTFFRMVYSRHAQHRLEALIQAEKPDIAHLHMIDHQLSPSILHTLKKHRIPVIQTVHQYKAVCPNYRLYNMRTHQICEKCLSGFYHHPVFARCHKDSALAGLMIGLEMAVHKLMKIVEKNVGLFHVPSRFMGEMLKRGGIDPGKIEHLFYTIDLNAYPPHYESENYFIYYGRLAEEKGIMTLLDAMRSVKASRLLLLGEGPQREKLEAFKREHQLDNVTFAGLKSGDELKSLVSRARFVVVPSEWYDNSPLVIYESMSMGKPVVGTNLGGIPELIDHEETGLVYEAGDTVALAGHINRLTANPDLCTAFGRKARKTAEALFGPGYHYDRMMDKYERLIQLKRD